MVVEQQDSGVCLSTEPGSPSSDAPVELRSSVREEGSTQRVRLSRLVDGLERLRASYREMEEGDGGGGGVGRGVGGGKAGETSGDGEKELEGETEERVSRLAETMPDLSKGKGEKNEEGRDENERRMESEGKGVRCHHHLLMTSDDHDDENEARFCQICRKKEERMRALRRAIGDDQLEREDDNSSMASPWSPSSSSSSAGLALVANHLHHHNQEEPRSPSAESPSSTAGSDHSSFDQLSSPSSSVPSLVTPKQTTPKEGRMNGQQQHQQPPHRLALPGPRRSSASHSPSGGQSITGHSGQSSPRVSGQQQQALIQKLQGALAKMTPRMFKSTKAEPRPWSAIGTTQDQKILALMLAKKEAEERQRSLREMAHDQWEEEMLMKKEMMMKKAAATTKETTTNSMTNNNRGSSMRRRRNTGGDGAMVRQKDKLPTETNCDEVGGAGSEPQTPCSAHGTSHPTSPSEDRDRERGGVGAENLDKGQHTPAKSRPDKPQQQKSREKQNQAIERKKLVEQRLEQQRREMEEHLVQLKRKQEQDLQRANSVRMSKEQKQILRAKLKNLEAQQKQERISQLKRQSMVDLSQKQEEIQSRLSKAELKVQQLRHDEARKKREDLERKIEQSRLRQEQIETEQKQWQEELLKYQKWKDYQADGLAKETVTKKKEAACVERIQREKLQRENMKRLLNQEEQWLNDVEATIAMKDARIRTVQKEKEEQIQRSRAMASVSQRMREELKLHYSMNDLDQVTRQVVLENRLVSKGPQNGGGASRLMSPPSHNASSLTLGCVDEV